jgi:gamma-glutamyl-gamma-aminobutyrate hydrolase PuuD
VSGHATKPIVGVSTYVVEATWGHWTAPTAHVPYAYVDCLLRVGAIPVLLPPTGEDADADAAAVAARIDALVLVGGPDVDPSSYGAERHAHTVDAGPERDAWEMALTMSAIAARLPVLGICRGAEILNIACGGTLCQHLPDDVGHEGHRPDEPAYGVTDVTLDPDQVPGNTLGDRITVSCYHHQAIDELGTGLVATGWAADGTVEAMRLVDSPFTVGVQWHPEIDRHLPLFAALVAATREHVPT